MTDLTPFYDQVQSIYDNDHTTELLDLFLDRTLLYSCAYFEREDMTLEEAQIAKLDLALGKCEIQPGQSLLEIGCGWGACTYLAAEKYRANVTALTLSKSQHEYTVRLLKNLPPASGQCEIRLQGWEECHDKFQRIISIAAFEHFGRERHRAFFELCRNLLVDDGRMLLHTIVMYDFGNLERLGIELTHEDVLFLKFIARDIFPGGHLVDPDRIVEHAEAAGFRIERAHSLQQHYARTLEMWADNLRANRLIAIERTSAANYDRYMKYLGGCARMFRTGHIDLFQFTLCPV